MKTPLANIFFNKRRVSQLQKDRKMIVSAMKKMCYSHKTGTPINNPGEQLIEYPLAISDNTGQPVKGKKSYMTRSLESR